MDDAVSGSRRRGLANHGDDTRQPLGQLLSVVSSSVGFGEPTYVYVLSIQVRLPGEAARTLRISAHPTGHQGRRFVFTRQDWRNLLDAAMEEMEGHLSVHQGPTQH